MIVISDTSPITNLLQIGQIELLHQLFGQIIIPEHVFRELSVLDDHQIALSLLDWVKVYKVKEEDYVSLLQSSLDRGEAEAIVLAVEMKAEYLLIDEKDGRAVAKSQGLKIVGILGILTLAKKHGLIDAVHPVLKNLTKKTNFRVSPNLIERVLAQNGESK